MLKSYLEHSKEKNLKEIANSIHKIYIENIAFLCKILHDHNNNFSRFFLELKDVREVNNIIEKLNIDNFISDTLTYRIFPINGGGEENLLGNELKAKLRSISNE